MQNQYPPSGRIFKTKSTHPKAPDMDGTLEIDDALLQHLLAQAKGGQKIEMSIAAYENTHPNHGVWYRLIAKKPFVKQNPRETKHGNQDLPF
jgi:hypothetical protein